MQIRREPQIGVFLATVLLASFLTGCLGIGGKKKPAPDTSQSAEPDKVLFNSSMDDIQHGRYTVARLSLQTLINSYPDSEYLAKAKLAIADSYYKEGGTSGLTQAISEYKDFITFFPFLDEAAYAQMQVAMTHYRMMEKPDRDSTQARAAEDELQTFLLKYPQSPLVPQAEQHLREVQEVLAEGDYRVAHFYYVKRAYRASAARLLELADRYPLYSQSDQALWILGDIYEKAEHREVSDKYYERIVRDYPLSPHAEEAKQKLVADGIPVPQPDAAALARMQHEQETPRTRHGLLQNPLKLLKSGPDVSMAAHAGQPNLNPPNESVAASEILRPGPGGTALVGGEGGGGSSPGTGSGSVAVETVPAGSSANATVVAPNNYPPTSGANPAQPVKPGAPAPPSSTKPPANGDKPAASTKDSKASKAEKDKKNKESTSKKKKGLRKIIPW
jgi:outer membrane protein assembly factor BamD